MRLRASIPSLVAVFAVFALEGCTDPVDAYLDSYDTRIHEACECFPILGLTDDPQQCYAKLGVTPTERECVHVAVGKNESAQDAYKCRGDAEEDFVGCISGIPSCNFDAYGDCEDTYKLRTDGCPDVPDSVEQDVKKCLD